MDAELRDARRRSFDDAAEDYDATRPGYPVELFDELARRVPPPADILEVGPGTGQATGALLERGYRVLAVEPGARLAAHTERKLAGLSLTIHVGRLEDWPMRAEAFDLAVAFSSFHWVDTDVGYRILAEALRPGGLLALAWNEPSDLESLAEGFEEAVQPIYLRCAPMLARDAHSGRAGGLHEVRDWPAEIDRSGRFHAPVERLAYPWSRRLDTEAYLRLLDTYSGHRQLSAEQRRCLHSGIGQLLDERFDGDYLEQRDAILYLARRDAIR
jgi:SAM-dependent methyltransferase